MSTMDLSTLMPQQREIVTTLDRPLFVSAGAGSGKTFTLTRRILWALSPESGPFAEHLDQVLAITFTKDAAAEIRERVRAALIEAGMAEEALTVDDSWISTIHGMCSRILRTHALELGIDPAFEVLEEGSAAVLMDRAVEHVLSAARDERGDGADPFAELKTWYPLYGEIGPSGSEMGTSARSLVRRLLEVSCALPHGMDDINVVGAQADLSSLADAYRPCLEASPGAAECARTALAAIDVFEASEKTMADLGACMLACSAPRASKAFPKDQVLLLKAEAADSFINAMVAVGSAATEQLFELARRVEAEYRELKRAVGGLDNNDLLRMTHEALRDYPSVRSAYENRFKLVMIDEFQDTDQQQVDLISYLTGEDGRALCTVGDAQQSIYRFRGADVEVFRRQERSISQAAGNDDSPSQGRIVKLVRNFRSHAQILEYVARVFDGEQGGLIRDFLDLEAHEGRRDALVAADASRRQAIFVAGGSAEERIDVKAATIAARFKELADKGQPVGGMVLLLGGMTFADRYAAAFRARGLDCVISGGSVFSSAPEVSAVRALVCALANPADTAQGLMPLLASPMFALGVEEFLALATTYDPETGETRRRNLDAGIASDDDAPGFENLRLLHRARQVLRYAFARVGRDSFARIARDVINASGWFVRLAKRGPEGRAIAANVLKALDALQDAEDALGNAPRQIAGAFDAFLAGKEAPGALNEGDASAVRIMTVHASKGLEFPVVAVADCYSIHANSSRMQMRRAADHADVSLLPTRFAGGRAADGTFVASADVEKAFNKYFRGSTSSPAWLDPELMDDVCATDSAAGEFVAMREEDEAASLEERARLLYVAMTRAREVLILALDAGTGTARKAGKVAELKFNEDRDLTAAVLDHILPKGISDLAQDRLVFEGSKSGDYAFIPLGDFSYGESRYIDMTDTLAVAQGASDTDADVLPNDGGPLDTFTLAYPEHHRLRSTVAPRAERDSYSYSSMAATLDEEGENRLPSQGSNLVFIPRADALDNLMGDALEETLASSDVASSRTLLHEGDPCALGSAFHAAAQWLIETGSASLPPARAKALCSYWKVSASQRARFDEALGLWSGSDVRAELLGWPRVLAEVPFFSLGLDDDEIRQRFGGFAEGAIDALAYDPANPSRALVIDYKTGGSPDETLEELRKKHGLQARIYLDVLHRAGFCEVTLKFVRVEVEDPQRPGQPQVITYRLRP